MSHKALNQKLSELGKQEWKDRTVGKQNEKLESTLNELKAAKETILRNEGFVLDYETIQSTKREKAGKK